ncbi:MAG TPA: HTTM domain-containing protein [Candidatus Binatia bacterium]|nr:HTTM domain-containing protein [Candidatus Binatia bacterium]
MAYSRADLRGSTLLGLRHVPILSFCGAAAALRCVRAYGAIAALMLARIFAIDARALAALRIGVCCVALLDLTLRVPDLSAHYTDRGMLARADALTWFRGYHDWTFCLHLIGGALWTQIALFALHAAALLCMLVGWHTRAASVGAWLLTLSLTVRNPFLSFGGDVLLRSLLFWMMLVPVGAAWSVDARRTSERPLSYCGIAGAGLLVQVWLVLFLSGLPKLGVGAWLQGQGLAFALDQEETARPLGWWLRSLPSLNAALSWTTVVIELVVSTLLWLPAWWLRVACVMLCWAMLAGIYATIDVYMFPMLTAVSLLVFVPARSWDWMEESFLRSDAGRGTRADHMAEVMSPVEPETGSSTAIRWSAGRYVREALAALAIVYLAVWNVGLWRGGESYEPPQPLAWFGRAAMMRQSWAMFTEFTRTGWFDAPGTLADGRAVDLLADGGPLPELEDALSAAQQKGRPADVHAAYGSTRWLSTFKIMRQFPDKDAHFAYYGRYLCREWNRRHSGYDQIVGFQIVFHGRQVGAHLDRMPVLEDYTSTVLWTHDCFQ